MQYVLLVYHGTSLSTRRPEDEQKRIYAEWARSTRHPASPAASQWGFPRTPATVRVQGSRA